MLSTFLQGGPKNEAIMFDCSYLQNALINCIIFLVYYNTVLF